MPSAPPSRPKPLSLMPPNGVSAEDCASPLAWASGLPTSSVRALVIASSPFAHEIADPADQLDALPGLHLAPDLETLLGGGNGGVDILLGRAGHLAQ